MIDFLAARSGGDARSSLNALELALDTAARTGQPVTLADAEDAMQRKALRYDKAGDQHYDYISAWIKSTRGSDPDASLYYLAAMLEGGEDARFIVRRMVIFASEDVGNADPQALHGGHRRRRTRSSTSGCRRRTYALAQAAIYLALAPKSNAAGQRAGRRAGAHPRARGGARRPPRCAPPPTPRRASSAAGSATSTRTTTPGDVNDQEHLPEGPRGRCASTSRARTSRDARAARAIRGRGARCARATACGGAASRARRAAPTRAAAWP